MENLYKYFICCVCCLYLAACNSNDSNQHKNENKNIRNVLAVAVSKLQNYSIDFVDSNTLNGLVFNGIISPRIEYNAAFRVSGKIIQQDINVGDVLQANQQLAKLDLTDFILAENIAQSAVNNANSNFVTAQNDYLRYKKLADSKFISPAMLENKLNILNATKSQLAHSNSQLKLSKNQKNYAVLKNENSKAIVLQKFTEVGQVVSAGQAIYKLAIIGENNNKTNENIYEVVVDFPENKIQNLTDNKSNLTFEITIFGTNENKKLSGYLREISPNANPVSKTYKVKIAISNDELKNKYGNIPHFLFGQNAKVELIYSHNENKKANENNIYEIPLTAIQNLQNFQQKNNETILKITNSKDNLVKYKKVKILNTNYQNETIVIQTLEKFNANDYIILSGLNMISENEKVKINTIKDNNQRR